MHCSGGAQTKVLHFLNDGLCVVKDNLFPTPLLFRVIQKQSQTDWREMYKVFNMGHRMEIYVDEQHVEKIITIAKQFDIDAKCIGRVDKIDGASQVVIRGEHGTFQYSMTS